jgi:hypothetical protein
VHFGQDALPFCWTIRTGRTATVSWFDGSDAFLVESTDQLGDGLSGFPTGRLCCLSVGLAIRNSQYDLAAGNVTRWLTV